ncbi:MAG: hypothetical protein OXN17_16510 [Candidatus Poribacteria bacterium]|nr:hypothetical protein [Candidatus Poribacteria bacterium]MDE0505975.1 hypothetical protein [Candidatus Poribacteria bacterium]
MNSLRPRLPSESVIRLVFLVAAEVVSIGEVLMLIDDEDSIEIFHNFVKSGDDSKRTDTSLELLTNKDSFPRELDRQGAVVAFRGSGNAVRELASSGLLREGLRGLPRIPWNQINFATSPPH